MHTVQEKYICMYVCMLKCFYFYVCISVHDISDVRVLGTKAVTGRGFLPYVPKGSRGLG